MSDTCSRRGFLQVTGGCFAASLAAAGVPAAALAAPIRDLDALFVTGAERTYPLPPGDSVSIDRAAQVILVRAANRVYAFALSCPHQNAAVKWVEKANRFQCTKHDSKYQPDGVYLSGRATRNLDRFPIRRDQDTVVIETSRVFHSDKDPAGWAGAVVVT
jgi:nitrite reductase/ring-hydroxylating ferredoxin subunit